MRKRAGLLTVLVAPFVVSARGVPGPVVMAQGAGERVVALPAGTASLGLSTVSGTDVATVQAQLADPDALDTIWQFREGEWLSFRPAALAFLNSLDALDPLAPLLLTLSAATTWSGPVDAVGEREVAIAAGFTAVTYSGPDGASTGDVLDQFANAAAVEALFSFDGEAQQWRSFRSAGPDFLNDLESLGRFDVVFVLASAATAWTMPDAEPGATFTVNTVDDHDDGVCDAADCSLREAIDAANASPGADTIVFDLPGVGEQVIALVAALPVITEAVTIDGTTQAGFDGDPLVTIDASGVLAEAVAAQNGAGNGRPTIKLELPRGDTGFRGLRLRGADEALGATLTGGASLDADGAFTGNVNVDSTVAQGESGRISLRGQFDGDVRVSLKSDGETSVSTSGSYQGAKFDLTATGRGALTLGVGGPEAPASFTGSGDFGARIQLGDVLTSTVTIDNATITGRETGVEVTNLTPDVTTDLRILNSTITLGGTGVSVTANGRLAGTFQNSTFEDQSQAGVTVRGTARPGETIEITYDAVVLLRNAIGTRADFQGGGRLEWEIANSMAEDNPTAWDITASLDGRLRITNTETTGSAIAGLAARYVGERSVLSFGVEAGATQWRNNTVAVVGFNLSYAFGGTTTKQDGTRECLPGGLRGQQLEAPLSGNLFEGNGTDVALREGATLLSCGDTFNMSDTGVHVCADCSATLVDNTFSNSGTAVRYTGQGALIALDSDFFGNDTVFDVTYTGGEVPDFSGNDFADNGIAIAVVIELDAEPDSDFFNDNFRLPYENNNFFSGNGMDVVEVMAPVVGVGELRGTNLAYVELTQAHGCCLAATTFPDTVTVRVTGGSGVNAGLPGLSSAQDAGLTVTFSGASPWVEVSGPLQADGTFSAEGFGTVAGFPNIRVTFTGALTATSISGVYTLGVDGGLPQGGITELQVDGDLGP